MTLGKSSVEMENQTLTEGLDANKRVIEAARRESQCLEKQLEELEKKLLITQRETEVAEQKLQTVLKQMASLLGESGEILLPKDKNILDKLCNKVSNCSGISDTTSAF